MLSLEEQEIVSTSFWSFEHEWRLYQWILGEAFLIDKLLCYFDGRIVYVCGFPLEPELDTFDYPRALGNVLRDPRLSNAEIVDLWGPTESVRSVGLPQGFDLLEDHGPLDAEHVIDVAIVSASPPKKSRAAENAASNRGYRSVVVQPKVLGYEHINLIRHFCVNKEVPATLMSFVLASPFIATWDDTVVVEARRADSTIDGFALVSRPRSSVAVLLQAFYRQEDGSRGGDVVMSELIRWAKREGIAKVHLGYSPSKSLQKFKEKWGGTILGTTYSEVFLGRGRGNVELVKSGFFPWKESLMWHRIKATT